MDKPPKPTTQMMLLTNALPKIGSVNRSAKFWNPMKIGSPAPFQSVREM